MQFSGWNHQLHELRVIDGKVIEYGGGAWISEHVCKIRDHEVNPYRFTSSGTGDQLPFIILISTRGDKMWVSHKSKSRKPSFYLRYVFATLFLMGLGRFSFRNLSSIKDEDWAYWFLSYQREKEWHNHPIFKLGLSQGYFFFWFWKMEPNFEVTEGRICT